MEQQTKKLHDVVVGVLMPWNDVLSVLSRRSEGVPTREVRSRLYGGLLTNTYKFAPRLSHPRDPDHVIFVWLRTQFTSASSGPHADPQPTLA